MKNEVNKNINNALIRRKTQNTNDYFFKEYIKKHDLHLYKKAAAETNTQLEKARIIKIIRNKVTSYRRAAKLDPKHKKKYGHKILALHEILYILED